MSRPIKKNPRIGSGAPTLAGIRTLVICGRFLIGESIFSIALDYGLTEVEVQNAIRYEVLESTRKFEERDRARGREPGHDDE
jgi:uncharacterized protein (DUF433 family)